MPKKSLYKIGICISIVFIYLNSTVQADNFKNKHQKKHDFLSFFQRDSLSKNNKISTSDYLSDNQNNKWGVKFGGFVGVDMFWDTRRNVNAREGVLTLYPQDISYDKNGKDLNAQSSFNLLAMNSRLTARIQAPRAIGANISGMLEGWFVGVSNTTGNSFSLRHAFVSLQWTSTRLLIGQSWHPLFTEECFAHTVAGSTGAPFQPFSRAPQIRLTQTAGKIHNFIVYINSQRDYTSIGHNGSSSEYLRYSSIPESGLQYILKFNKENSKQLKRNTLIGIGGDYKYLIPREITSNNTYTHKGVHSWATILFFNHCSYFNAKDYIGIKAKAMWSCGFNDMLTIGGYAVRYYDNQLLNNNIDYDYTGLHTISSWIDLFAQIKNWEFGIFAGYCENIGSWKNIQDWNNPKSYFMSNYNIKNIYRISPRIKYNAKKLQFSFEPEYTIANYGSTRNSLGVVQKTDGSSALIHSVSNLRLLFSTTLFF